MFHLRHYFASNSKWTLNIKQLIMLRLTLSFSSSVYNDQGLINQKKRILKFKIKYYTCIEVIVDRDDTGTIFPLPEGKENDVLVCFA